MLLGHALALEIYCTSMLTPSFHQQVPGGDEHFPLHVLRDPQSEVVLDLHVGG